MFIFIVTEVKKMLFILGNTQAAQTQAVRHDCLGYYCLVGVF